MEETIRSSSSGSAFARSRDVTRAQYAARTWRIEHAGRVLCKFPTDLDVYADIIERTRPDVVVETGTYDGGSAAWFADRASAVATVDLAPPVAHVPGVTWFRGDSVEMAPTVREFVDGRTCLVSLDSAHDADHVLAELDAYAPIATAWLVVEDTAVDAYGIDADLYPSGGPGEALRRWLPGHPEWTPDRDVERFDLGMNPGGWLRRT